MSQIDRLEKDIFDNSNDESHPQPPPVKIKINRKRKGGPLEVVQPQQDDDDEPIKFDDGEEIRAVKGEAKKMIFIVRS